MPATTSVAGWFTGSPPPGATGSAIIAGHHQLLTGDRGCFSGSTSCARKPDIRRRSDQTTVIFRVTAVHRYLKNHFPTQTVYGATPDAELRLITCGGTFDSATGHYLSNIVVYAAEAR